METIIRKAVSKDIQEIIPTLVSIAKDWMKNKYPQVNFENVKFIFGTGCRARYFRNEIANGGHVHPTVFISSNRDFVLLYWKPSLGIVRNHVTGVGKEDSIMCQLVHELTHHVQYEKGERKGNELDTTSNELEWLKENRKDVYELFYN